MPWVVALHIAFMSAWFGCATALPWLLAGHSRSEEADERSWLLMMEFFLFTRAMTPAAVLTVITGIWLMVSLGFQGVWLPTKLLLVTLLTSTHLYQGKLISNFRDGTNTHGSTFFYVLGLAAVSIAAAIIVLVVAKPF